MSAFFSERCVYIFIVTFRSAWPIRYAVCAIYADDATDPARLNLTRELAAGGVIGAVLQYAHPVALAEGGLFADEIGRKRSVICSGIKLHRIRDSAAFNDAALAAERRGECAV